MMKCKSCSEEISQKFGHAIATNICPFCGQEIMSLELQVALSELCEVMKSTDQFKAEIFDWLQSNYQLISKDSEEYKDLVAKAESAMNKVAPLKNAIKKVDPKTVELDDNGNQLTGAPIQDQEMTNVFMKRAQVKPEPKNMRDIVNQIKKSGGASATSVGIEVGVEADPEEIDAIQSELSDLFGGDSVSEEGNGSSFDAFDDLDEIPAVVQAMASVASGGSKGGDYNARDVAKLQQLQNKSKHASSALSRGGSVGLIRR